jgi:hypothetical protein
MFFIVLWGKLYLKNVGFHQFSIGAVYKRNLSKNDPGKRFAL